MYTLCAKVTSAAGADSGSPKYAQEDNGPSPTVTDSRFASLSTEELQQLLSALPGACYYTAYALKFVATELVFDVQ